MPGPVNNVVLDDPVNDWWTNRRAITYTFGLGADAVIIPDKLNFELSWASSWEKSVLRSGDAPGTAGFLTTLIGEAVNFPDIMYRLHQLLATFKYKLSKNLTARAQYRYERYEPQDFARDGIRLNVAATQPDVLGVGAQNVYLGARATAYEAHIGALALVLKF